MNKMSSVVLWCDDAVHAFCCSLRGDDTTVRSQGHSVCSLPDSLFTQFDPAPIVDATNLAVQAAGITGPIKLVLPLQWVFVQGLKSAGRRTSLESCNFELEPYLPVPLEDVACSFESMGDEVLLGVAIPSEPLQPLLKALRANEIEISEITADCLVRSKDNGLQSIAVVDARWTRALIPEGASVAPLFFLSDGDCETKFPVQDSGIEKYHVSSGDRSIVPTARAESGTLEALAIRHLQQQSIAGLKVDALLGHGSRIRVLVHQCLGLAASLFLIVAAGMFLQTHALQRELAALNDQKLAVYREVVPASSLPTGAAMKLASERVRIEALARVESTSHKTKETVMPSPMEALRDVVAAIPSDVPILLAEARVDEHQMLVRGQTREHRDAERIVEAMNQVPGIKGLAPRTNRLKTGGVEFVINAGARHDP